MFILAKGPLGSYSMVDVWWQPWKPLGRSWASPSSAPVEPMSHPLEFTHLLDRRYPNHHQAPQFASTNTNQHQPISAHYQQLSTNFNPLSTNMNRSTIINHCEPIESSGDDLNLDGMVPRRVPRYLRPKAVEGGTKRATWQREAWQIWEPSCVIVVKQQLMIVNKELLAYELK